MEWLRDRTGETVNLAVREGNDLVYVERVASRHTILADQVIGKRAPLHVTAVGKVLMAELGAGFCREYATSTGLPSLTPHSRTDLKTLEQDITLTRQNGFALDDEEAEEGVGCIGVAVRDSSGAAVAGLSVSAPIERRQVGNWSPIVLHAGQQLSERLGFTTTPSMPAANPRDVAGQNHVNGNNPEAGSSTNADNPAVRTVRPNTF